MGFRGDLTFVQPTELSGPLAGQSALISTLDIFLGVFHGKGPITEPGHWLRSMRARALLRLP